MFFFLYSGGAKHNLSLIKLFPALYSESFNAVSDVEVGSEYEADSQPGTDCHIISEGVRSFAGRAVLGRR